MLIKLRDEEQPILSRPITDDEAAWIVSIGLLVGLSVLFVSGILMDNLGRKTTLIISYVPRLLFCFLAIFSTEYWMLLLGRAFAGMADLLSLSAVSTYTSEVANKEIRGSSGTMTQINSAIGMLIMFGVGPFVSYLTMNILMTCIAGAALTSKSIEVLTFLHGSEHLAHEEINGYSNRNIEEVVNKWELLKDRTIIKTILMVFMLSFGLQISGYNAVNYYLQTIFESANTTVSSEISSLIIGVIQLLACFCAFVLTNQFRRKPIICTSLVGIFIGMIGLGTFFTIMENGTDITGFLNYLPLISVAFVIFGYNAGIGSLIWMLVAELLYGPVRAYGMSLGILTTALTTFCITLFFPTLNTAIGASGTYWTFSAGCALVCVYIAVFVPETKDKTFAEIQTALGKRDSVAKDGAMKA
ncbi:Sugar transporter 11, partial [Operophtera brumata]